MDPSHTFTIQLTPEASEFVRRKVESGEYTSESEVIASGVHTLQMEEALGTGAPHDGDPAFEAWLLNAVKPAYLRVRTDPGRAMPIEQVEAQLEARRLHRERSV